MSPSPRYVCIHGHFYQPPRENPWLEAVEVQDSAAPYHDWNERVTRECYGPNTRSRLVDGAGKVVGLSNNYAGMSFNFGPTLLAWMEVGAPDVLKGIVEGDRVSRERRRGHGNALAQVYNHVIMPLAGPRDKRTQVLWGIADFRWRFGRVAVGVWLAETAADLASLEALAEAGIRFTVLAPRQARRWRRIGESSWTAIPDGIDPSRAYLCRLPSGRSIALFFYDAYIARQVAFEGLLDSGEKFLSRLLQGFDDSRPHAQLVHIATDGESYGHHHPFGDMALACVLDHLGRTPGVRLTNYGEYLELHPPEWEVEIHENSSWSCAHGVERWRSDCGCRMRHDWNQRWRRPLREALDWLKGHLDELFAARGRECFPDPWVARDAYVRVILDRGDASVLGFLAEYGRPGLGPREVREALWLLEMQRHGLLMFTSCGWFFDEISGLEPTQCLRYAARALQLARHFKEQLEGEFVQLLARAPSNLPQFPDGRAVWDQLIHPWEVDLDRVLAHHAISLLHRPPQEGARVYCFDVQTLDQEVRSRGEGQVAVGRLKVRLRVTWNEAETAFVVVHYGGLDFHAVLRKDCPEEAYRAFKEKLLRTFASGSLADVTALVLREFPGDARRLSDLFTEERRRIIGIVLRERFRDRQQALERLADQDEAVLHSLAALHYPIPRPLTLAASVALDHRLEREVKGLAQGGGLAGVRDLVERGKAWGYRPGEPHALGKVLEQELQAVLAEAPVAYDVPKLTGRAETILEAASLLGVPLDLWQAQNQLLGAYATLAGAGALSPATSESFARLAGRLNVSRGLLGWRP